MLRRAKRPPNKKKKKRYGGNDYDEVIKEERKARYLSLMPSLDDNDGGSKESEGKPSIEKQLIYTDTPSLKLEKIDDSSPHVQLQKIEEPEGKRLIKKNDIKVKPAPMPDDDGGLILYDQSEVLRKGSIKEKVGSLSSVWSKEDEITILQGLMKFKTKKGIKSKKIDYIALYESIKQSLHCEPATESHVKRKVKCLREKYKNNLKKAWTPSIPHEEELFYFSDKIWGDGNKDHEINQQFTCQSSTSSSSSIRPYESLDLEASDKIFVRDLGLALATINRNQSNPVQVALEQYKLVSQSLSTRKSYGNQILEARITPKKEELSELEEQKIARSYFDAKIQHARLVSVAYNASHSFENSLIKKAAECDLKENTPRAMNEGNCPPATIGCQKPITGKPSNTSPKSVSEMYHSQEREKKKKRKIKKQENHHDSSIPSHTAASSKEIDESATSSQIRTLADGMTVEVLVKGNPDGRVASPGNQVKIYFIAKLRDTECCVGSNSTDGTPHKIRIGDEKVLKGLSIGIEGMLVGEKRRLIIPPSLGHGCKAKPPILPDSWLQYDVELVDICE